MKPDAVLVLPESCRQAALDTGFAARQLMPVRPGARYEVRGVTFETVPAYNLNKKFHPRANNWVGYVVTVDGLRFYVAGDTDDTPEARAVRCDAAFLPAGGTYTMTAREAAALAACYRSCLDLARAHGIDSVDFPSISTGVYGYPMAQAASVALKVIMEDLRTHDHPCRVRMVCHTEDAASIYRQTYNLWYAETKEDRL